MGAHVRSITGASLFGIALLIIVSCGSILDPLGPATLDGYYLHAVWCGPQNHICIVGEEHWSQERNFPDSSLPYETIWTTGSQGSAR